MSAAKLVVHTDVLLEHLRGADHPSVLRRAMGLFFCYTTVFQAVELFAGMRTAEERRGAEDAMSAMKLLGLNPKNAPLYGRLFAAHPRRRPMDLLVAGLCIEGRLPLLTGRRKDFAGIGGLTLVSPRMISPGRSASDILNELGR
ncbi:MAG TPA: PIN domain-containing protein [Bacteroidota bacterium]